MEKNMVEQKNDDRETVLYGITYDAVAFCKRFYSNSMQ